MTALLDSNVLIALVVAEHVHHDVAADWLHRFEGGFATCPITQGSLVRFLLRSGHTTAAARDVVTAIEAAELHEFWPDSVPFTGVQMNGVVGHRQVTDAYLAQLARSRDARLATLDVGMAQLHSDVALLVAARTDG
ncbi:PIN domain-containing protein [Mycobacterium sp. 21AC1]|uniref:TA system VapC family ribonuclease toxin n=1 Tax=[Mycobacterium] appelbergii TaxID=2939269 RepID=UPI002938E1F6|nr:TA system VapC family ribonuclease toxin [Mycobacterium sp. 21AC1]MDV3130138.1 PIN domain-containing protein [Mycobacterium sp. 21AC1]